MSTKAGCPVFRICKPLANAMGLTDRGINVYIEAFNEEATRLGNPIISDDYYFSLNEAQKSEYLNIMGKRLSIFINEFNRARVDSAEDFDSLREALGSKAAYAYAVTTQFFSSEERESFKCEFVGILRQLAADKGWTGGELIDKYTISRLFSYIRQVYTDALANTLADIADKEAGYDDIEESMEELQQKLDFLYRILGDPDDRASNPGFFTELCIINSAEIKKLFGRTFNPESNIVYKEDDEDSIHVDEETEIDFETEERERWTIMMDSIDPSGSLSSIINNILGQIPDTKAVNEVYEEDGKIKYRHREVPKRKSMLLTTEVKDANGNIVTDYFPITVNPRVEARRLLRLINSCVTLSDMMSKLSEDPRYAELYDELLKRPMVQTTFMTAFKRYYLHYYYTESHKDGTFSEIHLNASGNARRVSSFLSRMARKDFGPKEVNTNVFVPSEEKGMLVPNRKNIASFNNDFVRLILRGEDNSIVTITDFVNKKSTEQKIRAVDHLLQYFGIQKNDNEIQSIVVDSLQLHTLLESLKDLGKFLNDYGRKDRPAISLFQESEDGELNKGRLAFTRILEIVEATDEYGAGLSGMVTYSGEKTKTLSANVQMSQLTQFIKECNFSDAETLKQILIDTYAGDSSLCEITEDVDESGNPIYNYRFKVRWIQDLYDSLNLDSGRSFRRRFRVSRNLGMDNIDFENISDKGHMLSILSMYFNNLYTGSKVVFVDDASEIAGFIGEESKNTHYYVRNSSKASYKDSDGIILDSERIRTIMIPTFITGDTLALRGVTSLHYDINEIIDGIFDFYAVDKGTSLKATELNNMGLPVSGNGKETFTKNPNFMGFCGFFNPNFRTHIKEDGVWKPSEPGYWAKRLDEVADSYDENLIKDLIRECLNSEFEYFYEVRLAELGISSGTFNISGKGIESYTDEELSISPELRDSFKAKMRDFYFNFRFSQMNQTAIVDISPKFFANSKEQQKRNKVELTNGIQLVTDAIDPKTMNPVWEDPSNPKQKVVYVYDIKPALSEQDEDMLSKIFEGTDYDYKGVYKQNTISDGQGWRSFSSWRKIGLSFCGKVWTQEMEDAYHEVQKISEEIYAIEKELESFEKFTLKEGSLEDNREAYRKKEIVEGKLAAKVAQLAELAVVFQPRKPVCNGIEQFSTDGSTGKSAAIPFQHKYAEIPIIPALYPKGSALRVMGQFMEEHGIDMICSDKCGKKGVFGEIDIQYKVNSSGQYIDAEGNIIPGVDENGNYVDNPTRGEQRRSKEFKSRAVENLSTSEGGAIPLIDMLNAQIATDTRGKAITSYTTVGVDDKGNEINRVFSGVIHECPLKTYLIQTNVPDHSVAPTLVGTQGRKIILGGINAESEYEYTLGGRKVKITGKQLITLWNALTSANFFKSYKEYKRLISDPHRLLKELSKNILNNDRSDLSSIDRMARNLPFWDPMLQRDTFATIISLFKSTVSKQKIHGGNIVQASSLGANITLNYLDEGLQFETDPETDMPIKCEAVMPFAFKVTDKFGDEVDLEYDDYCNPDGTFKVGRILEESDPEYNNYRAYVTEDGRVYKPKIEEEYPGILELVAYRIPTEREYSMLNLRIKRCCPKSGANYIQLPNICTTRAGFDFDIDKLYLVRRSFDSTISEYDTKKVWDKVFEENPEWASILTELRDTAPTEYLEGLKSKYEKRGLEIPKVIPLNMFWDRAVKLGKIKENKNDVFSRYADESTIKSTKFTVLDAFNADGSINFEKVFSGDVQKSDIDNLILDIMQARLSDPETAQSRFTAGGFEDTIIDAKFATIIQELDSDSPQVDNSSHTVDLSELSKKSVIETTPETSENLLFDDPYTSIAYNKLNQAAGKLIGIFANASANYFIQSKLKSMRMVGPRAIVFGSKVVKDGDVYKAVDENAGRDMLVVESMGKTTSQRLAELLAASVDAVKEPVLAYLNLNTVTADAAVVLVRMGYDTKDIGLLFNQPIIKEATTLMERDGITSLYTALDIVLKSHGMESMSKLTGKKAKPVNLKHMTREALAYNITKAAGSTEHYKTSQSEVVKVFYELMKVKEDFAALVQESRNTSSNSVKTDIGSHFADADRRQSHRVKDSSIAITVSDEYSGDVMPRVKMQIDSLEDRQGLFEMFADHPYAFEVIMYNLTADMFDTLIDQYTPFHEKTFSDAFATARLWSRYGSVSKDVYNDMASEITRLIIKDLNGDFNPFAEVDGITNFDRYVRGFDQFVEALSEDDLTALKRTELFNNIKISTVTEYTIDEDGRRTPHEYEVYNLSIPFNLTKEQKATIYNEWQTLFNAEYENEYGEVVKNVALQNFAKALFLHMYYLNGLSQSSNFSLSSVPMNVLEACLVDYTTGIGYIKFMDELRVESDETTSISKIMEGVNIFNVFGEFIKQHTDNSNYVFKVTEATKSLFVPTESTEKNVVTVGKDGLKLIVKTIKDGGGDRRIAMPYITIDGRLYELQGFKGGQNEYSCDVGKRTSLIYEEVINNIDSKVAAFSDVITKGSGGYIYGDVKSSGSAFSVSEVYTDDHIGEVEDESSEPTGPSSVFERLRRTTDIEKKSKEKGVC